MDRLTAEELAASLAAGTAQTVVVPAASQWTPQPATERETYRFADRVSGLATLYMILGILTMLIGLVGGVVYWVMLTPTNDSYSSDTGAALSGIGFWVGAGFMLLMLFGAVLPLVTAHGLREFKPWGRALGVANAILILYSFPIGTALGVWTLVVLLGTDASRMYDSLAKGQPLS